MTAPLSRRDLLHLAGATATLGISTVAGSGSIQAAAQTRSVGQGSPDKPATGVDSGARLSYRDDWLGEPWRTPEAMLMIHGVYESSIAWFGWVPRMAQEFRVLRPDLPGSGASKIPAGFEWSMASLTRMLAQVLDHAGVESAHIVGAKFGGSIAMQFAADYPQRTRTLTVASGPVSRPNIASNASTEPQGARLGSDAPKEEVEYWNRMMAGANREASQGAGRVLSTLNMDTVLPRISAPTLVITSDRSPLQSVEAVMRYQQKIPKSRLLVLTSDAYHIAVARADECVTNVLAFIKETKERPQRGQ
jgi:pimeloyl-ACP methyl ester carboxylesterase